MENEEFSRIRNYLHKTQKELAHLLDVSYKAIQSYEQGWRNIPSDVERHLLLFLCLKRISEGNSVACWETNACSDGWREKCIVWEYKARSFCWFLNGTFCQGRFQHNWEEKKKTCRQCIVFTDMMPNDFLS